MDYQLNQSSLFDQIDNNSQYLDLSGQSVLIGLSAGINSAALLCVIANYPVQFQPAEIHLYYAHLTEHSIDSLRFVIDCWLYAKRKFGANNINVHFEMTVSSVLALFESEKMIAHPTKSFCSRKLKYQPMQTYAENNAIDLDLVGYVREEKKRFTRQQSKLSNEQKKTIRYPIMHLSDNECFEIVDQCIGWHPAIYDILDSRGNRIFKHNNCLPCIHWQDEQYKQGEIYYPEQMQRAQNTANRLSEMIGKDSYWPRWVKNKPKKELPVINKCDFCEFD